jgi:ubiquitin C-terminal hydrolase
VCRVRGATCYLNSLIQMMFMTPELRQGLYTLDPNKELGLAHQVSQP